MKVFANSVIENFGIYRIEEALKRYAPEEVEFVNHEKSADLVIIYAFGQRRKIEKRIKWIRERGQRYAMVQIALRSTANPSTVDWLTMWENAQTVWSYYDLNQLMVEDSLNISGDNFYHAPLGVDPTIFKETLSERTCKIVVGDNRDESVRECILAAKGNVFSLGSGITDNELAKVYSKSEFVSGLRRKEGFELPVLEGLLCGARPICYDKPHYRHWFGDLAEYIPEAHPMDVSASLAKIFSREVRRVTFEEQNEVKERFAWQPIVEGFWERI